MHIEFWPALAFAVVVVSCLIFAATFWLHKQPASSPHRKRDRSSIAGIVLQAIGYAIIWIVRRPWLTPMFAGSKALEIALAILAMALAIASVWFCMAAIRTLGKQW